MQLHGVTFEWKEPEKHGNHQGTQRGFIAQDVEKVMPEWVGADSEGVKTLTLAGIEAMTVESLRALKLENDQLRIRSSGLEERMKAMEAARGTATSGFGGGGIGLGLIALAGAIAFSRRKRSDVAV